MTENFKQMLADDGLPVEEEQIVQEFNALVEKENLITNTSRMSPFWRLVTAIAVKPVKWLTDYLINDILPNLFVKTAKGKWLDIQVWSVGISRKIATKAQGKVTFIKKDVGMHIIVPKGTIIQTERINEIIYKVIVNEDTPIPSGIISADVAVIAENTGSAYNLSGGYYSILPSTIPGIEKAVNKDDWITVIGADEESDSDLRERYQVKFSSVGKHHVDSVYKSAVAEVAGLSVDRVYFLHDAPRGPGTANIYLLLDTGVTSSAIIDTINHYLMVDGHHGHGDDIQAFALPENFCDISCTLYFRSNDMLTEDRQVQIKSSVENMIRCAFRENRDFEVTKTYPYTRFSWSKLGEEIHEKFQEIRSIEWGQRDIESDLSIPRIRTLEVSTQVA
ncbi:TPA: baseplate J/gp47 family protein [Mannheimia haemolytica]